MQRWKEEFVGTSQRKCVHVHHNGDFEHGKVLYLEADWTYFDFLNAASSRLSMAPAARRIFNSDGVEIDDCMMVEDDDILFLSYEDDFIAPADLLPPDSLAEGNGSRSDDKIPHSIGGYKVGELLGRGGFGEVRVGEHQLTNERVALKFLRKSEIHSLSAAERTNTEIQCLSALKHTNIIRLIHHAETQNHVVLIFELMEGGDLLKYLNKRRDAGKSRALTEDEARHVFYQVLSAVSYAHNHHICHRDLKLENILLKDNTLSLVKIADFGLSDFYRPGSTMKSNCGTLSFLAPEVFKDTANAGPPLDVWSMGVILFALLCGRLPFEGPDLQGTKRPRDVVIKTRIIKCQYKIDEHLSPEAKDLLRRMLQGDPSERITIPEIFNHVWLRSASAPILPEISTSVSHSQSYNDLKYSVSASGSSTATPATDAHSSKNRWGGHVQVRTNASSATSSSSSLKYLSPVSENHNPVANVFHTSAASKDVDVGLPLSSRDKYFIALPRGESSFDPAEIVISPLPISGSQSKDTDRDMHSSGSQEKDRDRKNFYHNPNTSHSNTSIYNADAGDGVAESSEPFPVAALSARERKEVPLSTIKLIPLRRGNSNSNRLLESDDDEPANVIVSNSRENSTDSPSTSAQTVAALLGSSPVVSGSRYKESGYRPSTVASSSARKSVASSSTVPVTAPEDDMSISSVNSAQQTTGRDRTTGRRSSTQSTRSHLQSISCTSPSSSSQPEGSGKEWARRNTTIGLHKSAATGAVSAFSAINSHTSAEKDLSRAARAAMNSFSPTGNGIRPVS